MLDAPSSELDERASSIISEPLPLGRPHSADRLQADTDGSVGALLMVLHPNVRSGRFNHACERSSGWSAGGVVGRVLWECSFVPVQEKLSLLRAVHELGAGCRVRFDDSCWRHRDGGSRIIHWTAEAIVG